ncbi:MAG: alpha-L-fucosidase [Chloroflexota bacterium]|nr:alpha-L-fucosidase [Chloroflexota bacterium]
MPYEPNLDSLRAHVVPNWFHDAKFGLMVVWGLFSVPAWAPTTGNLGEVAAEQGWEGLFARNPYAEWYLNSLKHDGSPTQAHHRATYGDAFAYDDFVPLFHDAAARWNPETWGDCFADAGAKYIIFLTKHHDGFLLWNSAHPTPGKRDYQTQRDIPAELGAALRKRNIRLGLYYSGGLDWSFHHPIIRDQASLFACVPQSQAYADHATAHWRELIARYQPDVLWNDIGYPSATNLPELFADYYNAHPDGVINDRFAQEPPSVDPVTEAIVAPPPGAHYDFRTPEYSSYKEIMPFKWESTRGLGFSFSYNQNEGEEYTLSAATLIQTLVDVVSKNGNLLLSFGPMADGTIPPEQADRLAQIGAWLRINGDAIYSTRPWSQSDAVTTDGAQVRFTQKDGAIYATVLGGVLGGTVTITGAPLAGVTGVEWLGHREALDFAHHDGGLQITLPDVGADARAEAAAVSFRLRDGG